MSDSLLDQICTALQNDQRVVAVWLAGSRGRGTADRLSDIDIWVALNDDAMSAVASDPLEFVHCIVPTIMHMIAAEIAPPGGTFVGSWVKSEFGFEQVDWYLTPESAAIRADDTLLVYGDIPISVTTEAPKVARDVAHTNAVENLILSLQMINNMVKHARRKAWWKVADHARYADRLLIRASVLIHQRLEPGYADYAGTFLVDELPRNLDDIIRIAKHLLGVAESLAAEVQTDLSAPISAMRNLLDDVAPMS